MTQSAARETTAPTFAVLTIDERKFLVPQHEIRTIEPAMDMDANDPTRGTVGWLLFGDEKWPLFCLNGELDVLNHIPPTRHASILLSNDEAVLGILCDQIGALENKVPPLHSVPLCMQKSALPIESLVILDGKIECITNTALLVNLLAGANDSGDKQYG